MAARTDIAIVGGGIVGLATGLELLRRFPALSLTVLEKESAVARHQTGHNSGVIHSGIYYKPGSLKARLCVEGVRALTSFCDANSIPYEICGKLIIATRENEFPQLEELYRRGTANGLAGLRILSAEEMAAIEPHAAGLRAIHVPGAGIVDYSRVARKYAELITNLGGTILLSHEVTGLRHSGEAIVVETTAGPVEARFVVNCAGLHSDRIARVANSRLDLSIVPFRGEYYDIVPAKHHLVKSLIYPVPDPRFPFLGVHFTTRIGGGVEAGPNAVLALKREGYSKTSFHHRDVFEYATFPGFWRMAQKHWRLSIDEYYRSFSKAAFVRALQRLVPEIASDDLKPGGSGVRAQALGKDGKLLDDFRFVYGENILHVCNVPSPAATASLAIAGHIVDMLSKHASEQLQAMQPAAVSVPRVQ
jgi:(S)-2-hydroxyglutarate dehydrogenase